MKTIAAILILCTLILTTCTPATSFTSNPTGEKLRTYYVPYIKADIEDEPYKVTKHLEGAHTEDILIDCIYDDLHHIYRVTPSGESVNMFEFDWKWNSARLLPNGNYLMGEVDKRIIEINPRGEIVWKLELDGVCHQTVPLPNGNLLVGLCYLNGFMEVGRNGKVAFEWYAKDHISGYDLANFKGLEIMEDEFPGLTFYNPLAAHKNEGDWTHLNFAQKLPNGNYIASLRNLDLIVEVNRDGEIVWSYGPGIIKHQHTPIVYGDYMYVFDNGNGRVIKLNRNTGRIVLEIRGVLAPRFGDVRRLPNNNLLITDSFHNRAFEINEKTGKVVWEIQACSSLYRVWVEGTW